MTRDTRIALFLMGELVTALCSNEMIFRPWLCGGVEVFGKVAMEEMKLERLRHREVSERSMTDKQKIAR